MGKSLPKLIITIGALAWLSGCDWAPSRPFERNAPAVDRAITALDAGDPGAAADLLEQYLGTGSCTEGSIEVPQKAREKTNASFDLGLALFHLAEKFGPRFGLEDEEADAGPEQESRAQLRADQAECAIKLLAAIAVAPETPAELAARARYLQGNLEFLRRSYKAAVNAYDEALRIIPGFEGDAGDGIGRDAAWNRAIALRRIEEEEKRDAGSDAPEDQDAANDAPEDQESGPPDADQDAPQESGQDSAPDGGDPDGGGADGGSDGGADANDAGNDDQNQGPEAGPPDAGKQPPPPDLSQDERMLDMLEAAPMVQLQDAKNRAARRVGRGMADK